MEGSSPQGRAQSNPLFGTGLQIGNWDRSIDRAAFNRQPFPKGATGSNFCPCGGAGVATTAARTGRGPGTDQAQVREPGSCVLENLFRSWLPDLDLIVTDPSTELGKRDRGSRANACHDRGGNGGATRTQKEEPGTYDPMRAGDRGARPVGRPTCIHAPEFFGRGGNMEEFGRHARSPSTVRPCTT